MNKALKIGAPIAAAVVVVGIVLGVLLPGGDNEPPGEQGAVVDIGEAPTEVGAEGPDGADLAATASDPTARGADSTDVVSEARTAVGDDPAGAAPDAAIRSAVDGDGGAGADAQGVLAEAEPTDAAVSSMEAQAESTETAAAAQAESTERAAASIEAAAEPIDSAASAEAQAESTERAVASAEMQAQSTEAAAEAAATADQTDSAAAAASTTREASSAVAAETAEPASAMRDSASLEEGPDHAAEMETAASADAPTAAPSQDASADAAIPPSFDVVRINPEGNAVMAGRAEPNAEITVEDQGATIGTTRADDRGEWVLLPDEPIEGGSREFSLVETLEDGATVESDEVLIVSVPERDGESAGQEAAQDGTLAVAVPRDGEGASRVLQRPSAGERAAEGATAAADTAGEPGTTEVLTVPDEGLRDETEDTNLSVDTVDYDDEGEVTIAGRADPGADVNVYVDETYVGTTSSGEAGTWEIEPGDRLEPGNTHRLRVDQVDDAGLVLARIETPLSRAQPTDLLLGEAIVVVQPGNSLWRIARRTYGGGVHFTVIYDANKNQIRDPSLIYPGQIFSVPKLN